MDNLHSDLREIVDHRDEVPTSAAGASSVRPFAARTAVVADKIATSAGTGWYHDAAIEAARNDAIDARANPYHH